ncbi:unnamed protein product, partial [Prunus brigantina]
DTGITSVPTTSWSMVSAVGPRPGLSSVGQLGFSLSCTSSSLVSSPSSSRKHQSAAAKTPTATNPGTENLFETAPFGAGASEGDPDTEEEGEADGEDDGVEGGESATGDVEGAAEGGVPEREGEALKGGGAEACLGESAGDLAGEDAGDCALVEATKRAAISIKATALGRAIVDGEKSEGLRSKLLSEGWV